ncbi:MAG: SDR family NAD(P)-dependent oxidoreductase [Chloroflexota bacterium]
MTQSKRDSDASPLKRAFLAIEKMQVELDSLKYKQHEPIAIVGMACRFPGPDGFSADTPQKFWEQLRNGVDAITEVPANRWDKDAYYDADVKAPGKTYTRHGGFLNQIDGFDPAFFGLSPREVAALDPQHRLLLETSWEALEYANLVPEELLNRPVGVFVGFSGSDYSSLSELASLTDLYMATGTSGSTAAGRISYLLGLTGPCMAIDTACSSSLTAVHLACQSLRNNECEAALAGGVSLMLDPSTTILFSKGQMLAADGRCKTFDAGANGYVRSEGSSMIVLKRLSDSVADNDNILAVIRGSAVNQDGPSGGLTVPNGPSQEKVIKQALQDAGLNPQQISYIEAHGTGTPLGDPIEIGALQTVFGKREQPLYVGSVKTNVGHLETTAGIAGLLKLVLSLRAKEIPPHLHLSTPNPHIDWQAAPIEIPTSLLPWPQWEKETPRMAGVSSFGYSGTNVHVIVAEELDKEPTVNEIERPLHLLTITAKNKEALHSYAERYHDFLSDHAEVELGNLCYTSHLGRSHFAHRLGIVADSVDGLQAQLASYINDSRSQGLETLIATSHQSTPKVAFLFTGQGAQYLHMGRDLYDTLPSGSVFCSVIDRCDAIVQEELNRSLLDLLYPTTPPEHNDLMESHPCAQAANFAIECALADLWKSWGIQPNVVLGHSLGDFAAAYAVGVLSLEDGMKLVIERGRLMETALGSMVSVMASEAEVAPLIVDYEHVTIGVINGPKSVVISGSHDSVATVTEALQTAGFKTRKLDIPVAAHSPMLEPVLDEFEAAVDKVTLSPPRLSVVSSMTGQLVSKELTDPGYWRQHLRNTVRFADGVATLYENEVNIFLEIGPKPTLLGLVERGASDANGTDPATDLQPVSLPSLRENQNDWQQMLSTLSALYEHGVDIDWVGFDQNYQRRKVLLPTYPFQRQTYWVNGAKRKESSTLRPLIDKMTKLPRHNEIVFETEFSVDTLPFLADHRVYGTIISPGACQLAMALSAAELTFDKDAFLSLEDLIFPQALVMPDGETRTAQVVVINATLNGSQHNGSQHNGNQYNGSQPNGSLLNQSIPRHEFEIISFGPEADELAQVVHATGHICGSVNQKQDEYELDLLRQRCDQPVDIGAFYRAMESTHIELGPNFRWLVEAWQGGNDTISESLGRLCVPEVVGTLAGHLFHPGLLDACFQVAGLASTNKEEETTLPFALKTLSIYRPIHGDSWWCHAVQRDTYKWDIQLLDDQGMLMASLLGFEVRAASADAVRGQDAWQEWLYQVEWQPRPYFGLAPDYLPDPAEVIPSLEKMPSHLRDEQLNEHTKLLATDLDALSIQYVLDAFAKVGLIIEPGVQWGTQEIVQQMGVVPSYRRLLKRLLEILADAGILQYEKNSWQVIQAPESAHISVNLTALRVVHSDSPELTLLERCGEKLSEVLRGAQDPLELLFPGGDTSVANRLYTESPSAQIMNTLMQKAVQKALGYLPPERGMTILEIGAGTGGTTAGLLPHLPGEKTQYYFTDIGPAFLAKAQEQFKAYPFIHYQPLDIEQPPEEQEFIRHQVDLVIAANVLHATRDLTATLSHVCRVLQPGGHLILLEATRRSRWVDLTFGLTDGWWRFEDDRQDHPLLTDEQWKSLLLQNGFHSVETIEYDGQAVFAAQTSAEIVENAKSESTERWVLFADSWGMGDALAAQLSGQGATPILIYAGEAYQQVDLYTFTIRPDSYEDYQRLMASIVAVDSSNTGPSNSMPSGSRLSGSHSSHTMLHGIVHLWSLDLPALQNDIDLVNASQHSCGTVLHLTQAMCQQQLEPAGFWLVTQDAQPALDTDPVVGVIQSALWGMSKVINLEHPELNCMSIDLEASDKPATLVSRILAEITMVTDASIDQQKEEQVALRHTARHVARLMRYAPLPEMNRTSEAATKATQHAEQRKSDLHSQTMSILPLPDQAYRLTITERGTLDNLEIEQVTRRAPLRNEVEVAVRASGLNFLDVLDVLGILPFERHSLGGECAGEVVQVGEDVTHFQVGDRVLMLTENSFSQYLTVPIDTVALLPPSLTFVEGASIPVNFLTAYYGLETVAHIRRGEKVLIHAAAGGTGMAAVQIALAAGAEIYATASPPKWASLREMGVSHIYNSRTLDFAEQILQDTNGEGINIVLNSLTGEGFIEKSLSVLAPAGRFLEIAKRNIWHDDEVAKFRADIQYHFVDLMSFSQQNPGQTGEMLAELMTQFAAGTYQPVPQTCFSIQEAREAFRYMQQAKQIGKIVLTIPATDEPTSNELAIRAEVTYVITGGLGGLGLAVAQRLAEQGARHLLLVGRSQPKPEAQLHLDLLSDMGVQIIVAQADVTNLEELGEALQRLDTRYPIGGVIHSVGVLDDGALLMQNWSRFAKVLAPKLQGTWHLHELTKNLPLDFFVVFSSATSLLGNAGQANHAAANAFLDAFVYYRRAQGLPALSINWGAWSEIGSAADLVGDQQHKIADQGQGIISPQQGLDAFSYLLNQHVTQVGVAPIQWPKFLTDTTDSRGFYANFRQVSSEQLVPDTTPLLSLRQQLIDSDAEVRRELLLDQLRIALAKVLGHSEPSAIDAQQGLLEMGLDSLMAIELRNLLARTLEQSLPSTLTFDYPTLYAMSTYILQELESDFELDTGEVAQPVSNKGVQPGENDTEREIHQDEESDVDENEFSTDDEIAQKLHKLESLLRK